MYAKVPGYALPCQDDTSSELPTAALQGQQERDTGTCSWPHAAMERLCDPTSTHASRTLPLADSAELPGTKRR